MADYPEHDKLTAISGQSQACGEFFEWLESRGMHLMTWREDLTDERPVDPECPARYRRGNGQGNYARTEHKDGCRPPRPVEGPAEYAGLLGPSGVLYWMQHCTHWIDKGKDCCLCGKGRSYEVTIKAWVPPGKNLTDLLAEFFGIDLARIEAEKRAMLDACRAMAEG